MMTIVQCPSVSSGSFRFRPAGVDCTIEEMVWSPSNWDEAVPFLNLDLLLQYETSSTQLKPLNY